MTASKFHELLEIPTNESRPSSSHQRATSDPLRFPIDGPVTTSPSRNSSRKLQRNRRSGSLHSRTASNQSSSAFSGPDADFDFGNRAAVQKIEGPPSPTEQENHKQDQKQPGTLRRRLRKLSLTG